MVKGSNFNDTNKSVKCEVEADTVFRLVQTAMKVSSDHASLFHRFHQSKMFCKRLKLGPKPILSNIFVCLLIY